MAHIKEMTSVQDDEIILCILVELRTQELAEEAETRAGIDPEYRKMRKFMEWIESEADRLPHITL